MMPHTIRTVPQGTLLTYSFCLAGSARPRITPISMAEKPMFSFRYMPKNTSTTRPSREAMR